VGFLSHLFGTTKLNADPVQQKLAAIIIEVAEGRRRPTDIVLFFQEQGWSRSDQGNRLTHALSMVRVARADLYPTAKEIGRQIYVSL